MPRAAPNYDSSEREPARFQRAGPGPIFAANATAPAAATVCSEFCRTERNARGVGSRGSSNPERRPPRALMTGAEIGPRGREEPAYFYADETLLWSIIDRSGESVHDAVSTPGLGPTRFKHDFPLYILTGPETASAAELFAYTLRSSGKAQTVGQRTMGVAHLVGALPINEHFVGRFSTYRNSNPLTNSNWEGVGVAPDTPALPEDSLAIAVRLATDSIARK